MNASTTSRWTCLPVAEKNRGLSLSWRHGLPSFEYSPDGTTVTALYDEYVNGAVIGRRIAKQSDEVYGQHEIPAQQFKRFYFGRIRQSLKCLIRGTAR